MTEAQIYAYEKFWDTLVTEKVLAKDYFEKGKVEGKTEGKVEDALNLKKLGVDINVIA